MPNVKDFVVNILGDDKTKKVWDTFQANAGKAAAGAAAAFAGKEIGQALLGNIDAESITDKLDASLGATAAQSEAWGNAAAGAYRNAWGESMEDASTAVEHVVGNIGGMRDAAEEDIQAATEKALALAQAMDVDVAESTTTAGILIKNGLAKDATEAFDLITAGLQQIPPAMRGEALDALNEYSVNFSQLGLTGEQAMSMLVGASANGSISIDKAGDSLKEFTIRATDMSKSSVSAYDTLGLNAEEMSNKILAGGDTASGAFGTIVDKLRGIKDPAEQANTAIALFGTPLEDLGTAEIPAFLDALSGAENQLGDTAGAADAMAATLAGNPKSRVEEMKRSFEGWQQDMVGMPGPVGDVAVAVQAFGGDAAQAATSVGLGVVALKNLKVGLVASKVATVASTVAQRGLNLAMKANPIGLIITLVAGLVSGLVWFFTKTKTGQAIVAAAWKGIKAAISAVSNWWTKTVVPAFRTGMDKVTGFFGNAKTWITEKWNALIGWFKAVPGRISTAVGTVATKIKGKFDDGRDKVKATFNNVVDWFKNIPGRVASAVGSVGSKVYEKFSNARTRAKDVFNNLVDWFRNVPSRIGSALGGVGDTIRGAFKGAFNAVAGWWNRSIGAIGFTVPNWVPKVGGRSFSVPNIPLLADGGIATAATLAMVGEGRGPEAIVPLDRIGDFLDNVNPPARAGNDAPPTGRDRAGLHIEHFHAGGLSANDVAKELDWEMKR